MSHCGKLNTAPAQAEPPLISVDVTEDTMSEKILVSYCSSYGSTAEIAERIGKIVQENGFTVDVKRVTEVTDPEQYDGAVIGSPVYSGEWAHNVIDFIEAHERFLRPLPVAIFTTALRLRDQSEEMRKSVMGIFDVYRVMLEPITIGLFAGSLDYSKLSPIVRLQLQSKHLPEGDFRDWDAIEEWARSLPELFHRAIGEAQKPEAMMGTD